FPLPVASWQLTVEKVSLPEYGCLLNKYYINILVRISFFISFSLLSSLYSIFTLNAPLPPFSHISILISQYSFLITQIKLINPQDINYKLFVANILSPAPSICGFYLYISNRQF